jgi:hypothetical protein
MVFEYVGKGSDVVFMTAVLRGCLVGVAPERCVADQVTGPAGCSEMSSWSII